MSAEETREGRDDRNVVSFVSGGEGQTADGPLLTRPSIKRVHSADGCAQQQVQTSIFDDMCFKNKLTFAVFLMANNSADQTK